MRSINFSEPTWVLNRWLIEFYIFGRKLFGQMEVEPVRETAGQCILESSWSSWSERWYNFVYLDSMKDFELYASSGAQIILWVATLVSIFISLGRLGLAGRGEIFGYLLKSQVWKRRNSRSIILENTSYIGKVFYSLWTKYLCTCLTQFLIWILLKPHETDTLDGNKYI